MVVGHVYQQGCVVLAEHHRSINWESIMGKGLNLREPWSMKGDGIRSITAANSDVLSPP